MYRIIDLKDYQTWDNIVKSFQNYTVFNLSFYSFLMKDNFDSAKLFFYDDGTNRGFINFIVRDISRHQNFRNKIIENTFFDINSPYGYGGFTIDYGSDVQLIYEKYNDYLKGSNYVSEFLRFNIFSKDFKFYSGKKRFVNHNVVVNLKKEINEIQNDFRRDLKRDLKIATNFNFEIKMGTSNELINDFRTLYLHTLNRNNAAENYYFGDIFFERLKKSVENHIYFVLYFEKTPISSELLLLDESNAYSFLGGTNNHYYPMKPNQFLKLKIIEWLWINQFDKYVLGGGNGSDDGIYEYKKKFSSDNKYTFFVGETIINQEKYNYLYNKLDFIPDSNFFPEYRVVKSPKKEG